MGGTVGNGRKVRAAHPSPACCTMPPKGKRKAATAVGTSNTEEECHAKGARHSDAPSAGAAAAASAVGAVTPSVLTAASVGSTEASDGPWSSFFDSARVHRGLPVALPRCRVWAVPPRRGRGSASGRGARAAEDRRAAARAHKGLRGRGDWRTAVATNRRTHHRPAAAASAEAGGYLVA